MIEVSYNKIWRQQKTIIGKRSSKPKASIGGDWTPWYDMIKIHPKPDMNMQLKQHLHRNRMANTCFITAIVAIAVPSYTMTSSISNQSPHNVPHVHMSQRHEKHIKINQKTLRKCFFAREKQASTPTYTPESVYILYIIYYIYYI